MRFFKNKNARGWVTFLAVFIFLILSPIMVPYAIGLVAFDATYSEGVRVGQVVKLTEKGLFWKTWEASLGVTQSGAYVDHWNFSVDNKSHNKEELLEFLQKAYKSGNLVEVKYIQHYGERPWRAGTSYTVDQITIRGR